jgi:predicted transcriptional regulator
MSSVYTDYFRINKLQTDIMIFITDWVHTEKTPVPYHEIVVYMNKTQEKGEPTVANALHCLLEKGYIRKAYLSSNKTFYVQLRTL